jgi:uncharacterized protein YdaU (DUF1376 family)
MNFFKLYIGDYQRDTGTLSLAEHGAYVLMLQFYCATEKPLPFGKNLYRLLRATSRDERAAIDRVVSLFWEETSDGLVNNRASQEIERAANQRAINQATGKRGGRPKKTEHITESVSESVSEMEPNDNPIQTPDSRLQTEDSRRGETPSVDQAIYADARKVFGKSIGGQIGKAIKAHGKPWVVGIIEACRTKDPEQARSYLAAAINGVQKPDEALLRKVVP